jgi:hypothetical protein
MDRVIAGFASVEDGDLSLCHGNGVAYQRDMSKPVPYDEAYFDKYVGYEGQEIARKINAARVSLVNEFVGPSRRVLDVGIGSGEFIKSRPQTYGYDVNKTAVAWLKAHGKYGTLDAFMAFTFWDVIEHVPEPDDYFRKMPDTAFFFTSLPIFSDLARIRESKHYRPNEHFYYWTERGFIEWMAAHRFRLLACRDAETIAGRESILSFAFQRAL